jgi:hypothetical protein
VPGLPHAPRGLAGRAGLPVSGTRVDNDPAVVPGLRCPVDGERPHDGRPTQVRMSGRPHAPRRLQGTGLSLCIPTGMAAASDGHEVTAPCPGGS